MTSLDLTASIVPRSDQLNAEDLLTGPRTVTISEVRKGSAEQPFDFHLEEFPGRPFRPSKTVRRIFVHAWGADAAAYTGRRMVLYRNPKVRFGGQEVGGIRVSALSHIDKPFTLALTETRGKRETHTVKPLADAPAPAQAAESARPAPARQPTADELIGLAQSALSEEALNAVARKAVTALSGADLDAVKAVVTARRAELKEPVEDEPTLDGWPATAEIPQ